MRQSGRHPSARWVSHLALVLTAHVVVDESCFTQGHVSQKLRDLQTCVAEHFDVSVEHSTFQIEAPSHSALERHSHH